MRCVRRSRPATGFSVIELLVVLAVASIVLMATVPHFIGLLQRQRMSTAVNDFFAAVLLARSEAIQRGTRVDLVPAGEGTDWARGWVVFIDADGNLKADAGERIIFAHGPVPDGMSIKGLFTDAYPAYLSYTPQGYARTRASSQAHQMGSWLFTLGGESRRIVVNFLGRPRVCNPDAEPSAC